MFKIGLENELLSYIAFLLQGICQIAVSVREMGLQFNSTAVGVNCQVNEALFVVDTGQVSMHDGMVGAQTQSSQVSSHSSENTQETLIHVILLNNSE